MDKKLLTEKQIDRLNIARSQILSLVRELRTEQKTEFNAEKNILTADLVSMSETISEIIDL